MTSVEDCSLGIPRVTLRETTESAEVDLAGLVREYSALLFRVAHSVLRSRAEAEDAVQDCFVRVLQKRSALGDVKDMRVWLVRIVWTWRSTAGAG